MPQIDWKKEAENSIPERTLFPEGTYKFRVVSWERVTAKSGTPQIRWKLEIVEPDEYRGKSILEHTAITDKALWKVAKLVAACRVDTSACGIMDVTGSAFDRILTACKERTLYGRLIIDRRQGVERNNIVDYKEDEDRPIVVPEGDSW